MKKYVVFGLFMAAFVFGCDSIASGRYELVQLGTVRADHFLLDTQTGRIWRFACAVNKSADIANCDYSVLEPIDVIGLSITPQELTRKMKLYEKPPEPNQ